MTTYHVTETKLVPFIRMQGLLLKQTSNWVDGEGLRHGGGAIFSFECLVDAQRWAARMDWEMHRTYGSGKISILTINGDVQWDIDHTDPISQLGRSGNWLKTFNHIPAHCIGECKVFSSTEVKQLLSYLKGRGFLI